MGRRVKERGDIRTVKIINLYICENKLLRITVLYLKKPVFNLPTSYFDNNPAFNFFLLKATV